MKNVQLRGKKKEKKKKIIWASIHNLKHNLFSIESIKVLGELLVLMKSKVIKVYII